MLQAIRVRGLGRSRPKSGVLLRSPYSRPLMEEGASLLLTLGLSTSRLLKFPSRRRSSCWARGWQESPPKCASGARLSKHLPLSESVTVTVHRFSGVCFQTRLLGFFDNSLPQHPKGRCIHVYSKRTPFLTHSS